MPIYITSVRLNAQTVAEAPKKAAALAKGLNDLISQGRSHTDPDLSMQGLVKKRSELVASAQAQGRAMFDEYARDMRGARDRLHEAAREELAIPSDPASLIRAEQRWRQVEQQLNAGASLQRVLRDADEITVRAVAEFAPGYFLATEKRDLTLTIGDALAAQNRGPASAALTTVERHTLSRMAQIAGDPNLRELAAAAVTADLTMPAAEPWLKAADNLVKYGRSSMLEASATADTASKMAAAAHLPVEGSEPAEAA